MCDYEIAANHLLTNVQFRPEIGIVCGSGLSGLSKTLSNSVTVPYSEIPGFPEVTVSGHSGEMVFGFIGSVSCVCLRGRFHYYEGNSMETVALPIRTMRLLGVKLLIVTNAAGGLNPEFDVGNIMIIQDHFGLPIISGLTPLRGLNDDRLGTRFPAVSDTYDESLQEMVIRIAQHHGIDKTIRQNGTYCFVSGPAYESKAESRFLRSIGGDAVGMSTVPEILAAKHCGMKILGLSLITNKVVVSKADTVHASHAEVLAAVESSGRNVELIVTGLVADDECKTFLSKQEAFLYNPPVATGKRIPAPSTFPTSSSVLVLTATFGMFLTCLVVSAIKAR